MASRNPERPNIVFILTDDQGYWALGCAGNPEIRTPHLDRLAKQGVRFENFFCTSPVCSPARASLLTGRIPSQHGVLDWIRGGNDPVEQRFSEPVEYLAGQRAYTDILVENGYVCGLSGKWHLGASHVPQKGFTHWFAHPRGGGPYLGAEMIRDGEIVEVPDYLTDAITDDALSFIETHSSNDTAFYCSVHYTAPHSPWLDQHPPELVDFYEDCAFESCPQEPRHSGAIYSDLGFSQAIANKQHVPVPVREYLKGYFASITAMDAGIGRILDTLDEHGLRENTLIFFCSDNGFNCGHHGIWGKGNVTQPLNMYDTSVKVPAIISQLGRLPEDSLCQALLSQYDFMPTLLDYLGLENPVAEDLPGRSFLPLLSDPGSDEHDFVVVFDEYGPTRMIRTHEWKYIHRYPYGPHELYDLAHDPGERVNLLDDERTFSLSVEAKRALALSLQGQLEVWFEQYVDPTRDGVREAVCGRGQLAPLGPAGRGKQRFHPRESSPYGAAI